MGKTPSTSEKLAQAAQNQNCQHSPGEDYASLRKVEILICIGGWGAEKEPLQLSKGEPKRPPPISSQLRLPQWRSSVLVSCFPGCLSAVSSLHGKVGHEASDPRLGASGNLGREHTVPAIAGLCKEGESTAS